MTDLPLPPLPEGSAIFSEYITPGRMEIVRRVFSDEQMQAYALEYGRMVAERCAEICESWADGAASKSDVSTEVLRLAAAIRANKEAT